MILWIILGASAASYLWVRFWVIPAIDFGIVRDWADWKFVTLAVGSVVGFMGAAAAVFALTL